MREPISAVPDPPFAEGARVRCRISTRKEFAGAAFDGVELRGQVGTVVRCTRTWHTPDEAWWEVLVTFDDVLPRRCFRLFPDELEPGAG